MLRITRSTRNGTVWLKLEGKLSGPWVAECRSACNREAAQGAPPVLDLAGITFVDREGLHLLRGLAALGVSMPVRSSFVAELLRWEEPR